MTVLERLRELQDGVHDAEYDALVRYAAPLLLAAAEALEAHRDDAWYGDLEDTGWSCCIGCGNADWKEHDKDCDVEAALAPLNKPWDAP